MKTIARIGFRVKFALDAIQVAAMLALIVMSMFKNKDKKSRYVSGV